MKKILIHLRENWIRHGFETLVVTIGILGAFTLNNWNEVQQSKKLEKSTIDALITEFESNKISLKNCLDELKENRLFADSIRMNLGPETPTFTIDQMTNWFGVIGETTRCEISTNILEDVRGSGNLKTISRAEIRRSIGNWTSAWQQLQREGDDWAREFSNEFIPYTNKWISWDDVDKMVNVDDPRFFNSKFEFDPRIMLQEFEFSNVMAIHYWRMRRVEERAEELLDRTERVLELMQKEQKE